MQLAITGDQETYILWEVKTVWSESAILYSPFLISMKQDDFRDDG